MYHVISTVLFAITIFRTCEVVSNQSKSDDMTEWQCTWKETDEICETSNSMWDIYRPMEWWVCFRVAFEVVKILDIAILFCMRTKKCRKILSEYSKGRTVYFMVGFNVMSVFVWIFNQSRINTRNCTVKQ